MTGFTLLRVRGIPIDVHASWLLLFAVIFQGVMGRFGSPEVGTLTLVAMATACASLLFLSILLHELGHALWALHWRWHVDRITLYGLGGLAWLRPPGPYASPRAHFQVIAAGPLVTLALVLFFGATQRAGEALGWPGPVVNVAGYLMWINAIVLLFNLAPAFPLDGGRMLRAWLWRRRGDPDAAALTVVRAGAVTGYLTAGGAIVLLATGALHVGFIVALASAHILFLVSRFASPPRTVARRHHTGVVGDLIRQGPVAVPENSSVSDFLDRAAHAPGHSTHAFGVTGDGKLSGYMSLGLAQQVPVEDRDRRTVGDTMVRGEEAIKLDPNTPLDQALEQLPGASDRGMVVEDGRVTGIVLRQGIAEALLQEAEARRGSPLAGLPW